MASVDGFCRSCQRKPRLQQDHSGMKVQADPSIKIVDTSTLSYVGSFKDLCQQVSCKEVFTEVQKLCREIDNEDISHDIAATVKYVSQLEVKPEQYGFECRICVADRLSVMCQYGMFPVQLDQLSDWAVIAGFPVIKSPSVSDVEAVIVSAWQLTKSGWSEGYYQWLGIDRETTTLTEFHEAVGKKLGM